MLTYRITDGQYGVVLVFHKGKLIAENLKLWCVRNNPQQVELMESWIGFNTWNYYGVQGDTLPRGITLEDVRDCYLVARDEIIDKGDCIPV